MSMTK